MKNDAPSVDLIEAVRTERARAREREHELEAARHVLNVAMINLTTFTAECSCRLWTIENHNTSHPVDADAARLLVEARHAEHVTNMGGSGGTTVETGYTVGNCAHVKITEPHKKRVTYGIICGGRSPRSRCSFCSEWSLAACDFPLDGKCRGCKGSGVRLGYNCHTCAGTGRRMCNKKLCAKCRAHKEPDEDYCPDHRALAGFPPLIRKEPCQWMVKPKIVNRKCRRESCEKVLTADDHVLFFPRSSRAMCEDCGNYYLEIAQ